MTKQKEIPQDVENIQKLIAQGGELTDAQLEILFLDSFLEEEGYERR